MTNRQPNQEAVIVTEDSRMSIDHSVADQRAREVVAQIVARAYGGSLYPGLGVPGDYPTDDVDYRAADAILAALLPQSAEPSRDMVMVPREPTEAMLNAYAPYRPKYEDLRAVWSAMLAASPQVPTGEPSREGKA